MDLVFSGGTTDYRHYIYAGSEPVAVYSRTNVGGVTVRYLLEDHQGSISAIAANSGVSDMGESFTAFGQRRSRTTWSGPPTTSDLNTIASISRQGYTFQTWLGQSMGLNHMNGRVQDAILGRFLSADPHIPDPTNAQGYNRYSYVLNNPVSFTDPTGFSTVCISDCPDTGNASPGPTSWDFLLGTGALTGPGTSCSGNCPGAYISQQGQDGTAENGFTVIPHNIWVPNVSPASTLPTPATVGGLGDGTGGDPVRIGRNYQKPTKSQTQQGCINWKQVGIGAIQTIAGAGQAVVGTADAFFGAVGVPETFGATAIAIGPGLANVGMGALAFNDGVNLWLTGLDGVDRGTALGNLGQNLGGTFGKYAGDLANLAPGVYAMGKDPSGGAALIMDAFLFILNGVAGDLPNVCP